MLKKIGHKITTVWKMLEKDFWNLLPSPCSKAVFREKMFAHEVRLKFE